MRQREDALAGFLLTFGGGVVVDLDDGQRESLSPSAISEPAWVTPEFWKQIWA